MTVRATIEKLRAEYVNAINRGDADAVADLWDANGVMLAPHFPLLEGRDAIRKGTEQFVQMGLKDLAFRPAKLEEHGDLVIDRGTYTVRLAPPGGPVIEDAGKDVRVWKRQADGGWKLYVDAWNTELPPPGMG